MEKRPSLAASSFAFASTGPGLRSSGNVSYGSRCHVATGTPCGNDVCKIRTPIGQAGETKEFWLSDIYRTKLCQPVKGGFGEAAVALYILFCGDKLRKQADEEYKVFSVELSKWLSFSKPSARSRQCTSRE